MKIINIFLLLLLFGTNTVAQDIYNLQNSLEYAQNLYSSHEYELAAQEYERVLFLDSTNTKAKLRLIKSFRKTNQTEQAIQRTQKFFSDMKTMPKGFANEYSKLLVSNQEYKACRNFINQSRTLTERDKDFYLAATNMFETDWEKAHQLLNPDSNRQNPALIRLQEINREAMSIDYKKPWLSAGLSTIVPGLGKVYSGSWKNGLVSLVFVGLSGWQAYRGFEQHGAKSAYGWIYGGIGLGFYLGNIFGSSKAANKYNFKQNQQIIDKVENIYIDY